MSCWTIIGIAAGACLTTAFVAVLLEFTYDAGFEEGFARGRICRKEAAR